MSMKFDARATQKALEGYAKQARFAASRTANGLALTAQKELRDELGQHFTVRRGDFLRSSIRVKLGDKANPTSQVGVPPRPRSGIDQALALQEFGGIETPRTGGHLAEPIAARPTPQAVTPPSQWPSKLKRSFKIKTANAGELILQRVGGKGKHRKAAIIGPVQAGHDPNLKVMYRLRRSIPVRKRWDFAQTCVEVAKRDASSLFAKEMASALRTAK